MGYAKGHAKSNSKKTVTSKVKNKADNKAKSAVNSTAKSNTNSYVIQLKSQTSLLTALGLSALFIFIAISFYNNVTAAR